MKAAVKTCSVIVNAHGAGLVGHDQLRRLLKPIIRRNKMPRLSEICLTSPNSLQELLLMRNEKTMTNLLRLALTKIESLYAIQKATDVSRQSMMKFIRVNIPTPQYR